MNLDLLCNSPENMPIFKSAYEDKLSPRKYDFLTEDTQLWYSLYGNTASSLYENPDGSYRRIQTKADDILLIPPHSHHIDEAYETPYKFNGYLIRFDCPTKLFELEVIKTKGELRGFFEKLADECKKRMPGYQLRCQILLLQLLEKLCERSVSYTNSEKYRLIEPAIKAIHEKYRESKLSVEFLSELCGITSQYFHRVFYEYAGTTPHKYIEALRMKYARELLESGKLTVFEAAELCGFDNAANFARSFKRYYKLTPTEAMPRSSHAAVTDR